MNKMLLPIDCMTLSRSGVVITICERSEQKHFCAFFLSIPKNYFTDRAWAEAFIAALKRFIARRGFCNHIYSDCGMNFVDANRLLREDRAAYRTFITANVIPALTDLRVQWHFIPPASPNFGGLWEVGVKSMKTHLHRIGKQ